MLSPMIEAQAVRITEYGGPNVLSIQTVHMQDPGPNEVRIHVVAAGLNRADILQRRGLYPAPSSVVQDIPGLEYAGTVMDIGSHVSRWQPGDRVMGIVGGGSMATHVLVHEQEVLPVPDTISLEAASAIPEAFITAYDALFHQASLRANESVLIHAVGSGIGTAATQLANATEAIVYGTSRTRSKLERCKEFGLQHPIHVTDGTFSENVAFDVILDLVGGSYARENFRAIAQKGRIVTIGLLGGTKESIPIQVLMQKRVIWRGSVLRSRPLEEKIELIQSFESQIIPLFQQGRIRPVVDQFLPMQNIREAHASMEGNSTFGKLVLCW